MYFLKCGSVQISTTGMLFTQNIYLPNLMEKLESVQYSAALAVTGREHHEKNCKQSLVGSH